ncbi:unnamed protein product [Soboliphyme baturini]|uniref:PIPK domain-containing protein n=1 Tax=Soboliphyme baturini TaxID=241478 RepID=A0A183J2M6_9BILA|nr:unnamed protein product [Soboliphyme baturini]
MSFCASLILKIQLKGRLSDGDSTDHDGYLRTPTTPGPSFRGDREKHEKKKIGHRRVDLETGLVTYKKVPTSQLMGAIQLGISNSVGSLASKPERDLLLQDFGDTVIVSFPGEGSHITPSHPYSDFKFKTYAPIAFRYFRELFSIKPEDFLVSLCAEPLQELSNPGASGSIFYISNDDQFIIKTVQHKEAEFLQKLLPGYYMNLNQNPKTLLPKFFGLYCYQTLGKNVRLLVMNNLLPSTIKLHRKYDLKGSTYKRRASKYEKLNECPTLKDLDFLEINPEGFNLDSATYDALMKIISRDCLVLKSFKIMDYSLLIDLRRITRQKTVFNTWESVRTDLGEEYPAGGIPASNSKGERLLLFLGVIDILQSYRFFKKFEHSWKSVMHDGVCRLRCVFCVPVKTARSRIRFQCITRISMHSDFKISWLRKFSSALILVSVPP